MTYPPPDPRHPYHGPPPTGAHPPQPADGFSPYPSTAPLPGYPPQAQFGYPPPGYPPPGYGPFPVFAPIRPGPVVGAAVLAFVTASLLVLASLFLITGASVLDALDRASSHELLADGLVDLVLAALLVGGGVATLSRSAVGRLLLSLGAVITLAGCAYWAVRWEHRGTFVSLAFYVAVFAILSAVALLLAWLPVSSRWFAHRT